MKFETKLEVGDFVTYRSKNEELITNTGYITKSGISCGLITGIIVRDVIKYDISGQIVDECLITAVFNKTKIEHNDKPL